jgi:hypothetical protein
MKKLDTYFLRLVTTATSVPAQSSPLEEGEKKERNSRKGRRTDDGKIEKVKRGHKRRRRGKEKRTRRKQSRQKTQENTVPCLLLCSLSSNE